MDQTHLGTIPNDVLRKLHAGWCYEFDCYRQETHQPSGVDFHITIRIPIMDDVDVIEIGVNSFPVGRGVEMSFAERVEYLLKSLEVDPPDPTYGRTIKHISHGVEVSGRRLRVGGRSLPPCAIPALVKELRRAWSEPHPIVIGWKNAWSDHTVLKFDFDGSGVTLFLDGRRATSVGSSYEWPTEVGQVVEIHDDCLERRYVLLAQELIRLESSDPHIRRFRYDG